MARVPAVTKKRKEKYKKLKGKRKTISSPYSGPSIHKTKQSVEKKTRDTERQAKQSLPFDAGGTGTPPAKPTQPTTQKGLPPRTDVSIFGQDVKLPSRPEGQGLDPELLLAGLPGAFGGAVGAGKAAATAETPIQKLLGPVSKLSQAEEFKRAKTTFESGLKLKGPEGVNQFVIQKMTSINNAINNVKKAISNKQVIYDTAEAASGGPTRYTRRYAGKGFSTLETWKGPGPYLRALPNTKTAALSEAYLSKLTATLTHPAFVVAAISSSLGTYPWALWAKGEGLEALVFARIDAMKAEDYDLANEIGALIDESTDTSVWDSLIFAIPLVNVAKEALFKVNGIRFENKAMDSKTRKLALEGFTGDILSAREESKAAKDVEKRRQGIIPG